MSFLLSAAHAVDHASAPLLTHHSGQQRSYHTTADAQHLATERKEEVDVEEGGRRGAYRSKRFSNYAAPILPLPSPSRAATASMADVDGEAPYESPFSAFSAYQSDYSSPGDTLNSAYATYAAYSSPHSRLSSCYTSSVAASHTAASTVYAVMTYPFTHPQQTALAALCACLLLASSGEQVTRKLLSSSLYNYRYALFLLCSLSSALLTTVSTLIQWRTVRAYLRLSSLPPFLPVLLLVLLSAVASVLLLLSTAILPAPVALLLPQLLVPVSLLSARWWSRQPLKRDAMMGCALIVLAVGILAASAIWQAEAQHATDAFIPSRAEVCWNLLLLAVSVLLSAAVWHVRASLLCAYDAHPLVLSSLVGWGQLAVGLVISPAALWLQYLGTSRWRGVDHAGARGGAIIGGGNSTSSSSSSGADAHGASSSAGLSSSMPLASSASEPAPSSTALAADSSSTSSATSSTGASSLSSLYVAPATSSSSSLLDSPSSLSTAAASTAVATASASSANCVTSAYTSLSATPLLSSTAAASSAPLPPSLSSSLLSILTLTSSYLFAPPASPALSPYPHLALPVIASPDYLPSPTAASAASHRPFHASTLLNLQHFTRCLLFAHDSEYGDTCASPAPLLPLIALFLLSCLATQYTIAALSKRSTSGASSVLSTSAVVAVLCFVWPAAGVSGWLPYHQRALLDGVAGGVGGSSLHGGLLSVCVALLCAGSWLCGREEERPAVGVNVWERVEALMREQETARGGEESRERRAAVRRARDGRR